MNGLNQYTAAGPAAFQYDANGNLTSDGSTTFVYDAENRLVSASGTKTASLAYDPLGRLWQVSGGAAGTTRFHCDGDELFEEYDAWGTRLGAYGHGPGVDEPIVWYELTGGPERRFLHADHQGSIIAAADEAGNALAINAYDAWGIPNANNLGRFAYTGQTWLGELGMYHYKARIYSPTLGRFLQTDPIGYADQVNLYAYVVNEPIGKVDPSGEEIRLATHNLFGGVSHPKIIIIPENQDRYKALPAFENNRLPDGRHYATIGAGPEGEFLVGRVNRPTDVASSKNNSSQVLDLPKGMTEDKAIANLDAAERRYNDSLDYDYLPGAQDGYNSNSYAAGVLREAGFRPVAPETTVPGFQNPIPSESFSRKLPLYVCSREGLTAANRSGC